MDQPPKILITHSYFLRYDPKQWATGQPYAPLGTLQAASVLREKGNEVTLFDTMFASHPQEIILWIEKFRPSVVVLYDDGFNYLTKMCLTNMRDAAFEMIRIAKQEGCSVIVSSSDATDRFAEYLERGADIVLLGEAEESLAETVDAICSGAAPDLYAIQGIAFREGTSIVSTRRRKVMTDLDSLPLPAWDLVDFTPYRNMWMKSTGYFSVNVGTTRGCPFKCNWCAKPIYGNRYNSRSPAHVVRELLWLKDITGFTHAWFCDDIFGLKPGWVNQFALLTEEAGLKFRFKIQSRADLLVQEGYVAALAKAGCDNAWMGAESGSQKILDAMDKGITVQQIEDATALLKAHGIRPSFFLQFGYPGETKGDIAKTISMVQRLLPSSIGISVSYPLPGTRFYENVRSTMLQKTNWTDSDELVLMFRNLYQPAFYRQLHRYVHRVHRAQLAVRQPASSRRQRFKKLIAALYYFPAAFFARQKLNRLSAGL